MKLDIGCGPINRADIRLDVVKSEATNILASAEHLPFKPEIFDIIYSSACFEHLHNPTKALKDLTQVLKSDGTATIEVPRPQYTNQAYYHIFRFIGDIFTKGLWPKELRWLYITLHRAKTNKNHPLVHKSIITKSFLSTQLNVVSAKNYAPMILLQIQHYVSRYFKRPIMIAFLDCSTSYLLRKKSNVDVIMPIKGNPEHLEECLISIYKTIPVNQLIVGNGGCSPEALEILQKFPNVTILDHVGFKTQGYSIRKLVEAVSTEWFVYMHSDVVLPDDWYQKMSLHYSEYDWFECRRIGKHSNGKIEELHNQFKAFRAYSGSQMGKTQVLKSIVKQIEDDYVIRTEDIVIQQLLLKHGYKYGKIKDTFHIHYLKDYDPITSETRIQTIMSFTKYLEPTHQNKRVVQDNIELLWKKK